MKQIGKIRNFNGRYGFIETENSIVDFSHKDISFNEKIKEGSIVEFRVEEKSKCLKLARNIHKLDKKNKL